jgi:urate oxidase
MSDDQFALGPTSYGKSSVRLVKVTRDGARHRLRELAVDVALAGDFAACYERGDNQAMPATDTMRNIVYVTAHEHPIDSIEAYGLELARRLLAAGPTVSRATVRIVEHGWRRLDAGGQPHDHAFTREAGEATAIVVAHADGAEVSAGLENVLVLKTTASGWTNFHRDQYTTLPDADDRILATSLSAEWAYADHQGLDFAALAAGVHARLLESFADHYSPSVQHTLYRMGRAVLERFPAVRRVRLAMPNKHHLLFNLAPFGHENRNDIFHVTAEPYGLIEGVVERRSDR